MVLRRLWNLTFLDLPQGALSRRKGLIERLGFLGIAKMRPRGRRDESERARRDFSLRRTGRSARGALRSELGDRRDVFSDICLTRLARLIMIRDSQRKGNFPSVPCLSVSLSPVFT